MNCPRARKLLAAYASDDLGPADRDRLETHLAACEPCRTQAQQRMQLWQLLGTVGEIEPSPQFPARVRQAVLEVDARAARVPQWWPVVPRLAWGMAVLAVMLIGGAIGHGIAVPPTTITQAQVAVPEEWLASAFLDMPGDSLSAAYLDPPSGQGVEQQ